LHGKGKDEDFLARGEGFQKPVEVAEFPGLLRNGVKEEADVGRAVGATHLFQILRTEGEFGEGPCRLSGGGRGGDGGRRGGGRTVVLQEGGMIGEFLKFGDEREGKAGRAALAGDTLRVVLPPEEGSRVYGLTRTQDASSSSERGGGRGLRAGRSKGHTIATFPFGFGLATAAVAELLPMQQHLEFGQS